MKHPEPLEAVFATTFLYSACKVVGKDKWPRWLQYELAHLETSTWAGLRTLSELRHVCDYDLMVDGSTYITRARSVASGKFLRSNRDVWVTVDDDLFASEEVLRRLILACRVTKGGVALPYMNRDGGSMTFRKVSGPTIHAAPPFFEGIPLRTVDRVGFGCVALHRDLVELLAKQAPHFAEKDGPPGAPTVLDCPALFLEGAQEGSWVGEDFYFSALCEKAGRPMHVLLNAPCEHAGLAAMLDSDGQIRVRDAEVGVALDGSLRAKEAAARQRD